MYNNNWFKWYYDSSLYSNKQSYTSRLEIEISDSLVEAQSFRDELVNSVKEIETKSRNVLLTNSSINFAIVKTFHELKIPVKVWIPRYGNLNLQHFLNAMDFCHRYKFQYEIVDLNVPLFFKNKGKEAYSKSFPIDVMKLPIIEIIEMIDKDLICSLRDPIIVRNSVFYDDGGAWSLKITEDDLCIPAYFSKNKNMHLDFFFGRKELIKSYIKTQEIQDLIRDKYPTVSSSIKIKDEVVKSSLPELTEFLIEKEIHYPEEHLTTYSAKLWGHCLPKMFDLNLF